MSRADNSPRFVYLAAAISALSGMLFCYDTGVISGAILFIQQDFALSPTLEEIVVNSVVLEAVLGAVAGGTLTDRFGRRIVLAEAQPAFACGRDMATAGYVSAAIKGGRGERIIFLNSAPSVTPRETPFDSSSWFRFARVQVSLFLIDCFLRRFTPLTI